MLLPRRRHEGPAVAAKLVDHADDRGFIGVDYGTDLAELGRPPRLTIVFALFRDPLKKSASYLATGFVEFFVSFVGVTGQRACHCAGSFVVQKINRLGRRLAFGPGLPGAHQGMLKDGKMVGIVADVVEQALQKACADGCTANRDWTLDC